MSKITEDKVGPDGEYQPEVGEGTVLKNKKNGVVMVVTEDDYDNQGILRARILDPNGSSLKTGAFIRVFVNKIPYEYDIIPVSPEQSDSFMTAVNYTPMSSAHMQNLGKSKTYTGMNENIELSNTAADEAGNLQGGIGPGTFLSHPKKPGLVIMITDANANGTQFMAKIVQQGGHESITEEGEEFAISKAAIDQYHKVMDVDPETAQKWRDFSTYEPIPSKYLQGALKRGLDAPGAMNEQIQQMKKWTRILENTEIDEISKGLASKAYQMKTDKLHAPDYKGYDDNYVNHVKDASQAEAFSGYINPEIKAAIEKLGFEITSVRDDQMTIVHFADGSTPNPENRGRLTTNGEWRDNKPDVRITIAADRYRVDPHINNGSLAVLSQPTQRALMRLINKIQADWKHPENPAPAPEPSPEPTTPAVEPSPAVEPEAPSAPEEKGNFFSRMKKKVFGEDEALDAQLNEMKKWNKTLLK